MLVAYVGREFGSFGTAPKADDGNGSLYRESAEPHATSIQYIGLRTVRAIDAKRDDPEVGWEAK